jgi:hypothetical protein
MPAKDSSRFDVPSGSTTKRCAATCWKGAKARASAKL